MLARLMECSELEVTEAAKFGEGYPQQVAGRLIESVGTFRRWEDSHSQLMRRIAAERKPDRQALAVRRLALSVIHRKAPFEYLRDQHVIGAARHRFFHMLYGPRDYANSMVREHTNYLISGGSYLCVERFCASATMELISKYEENYTAYFRASTFHLLAAEHSAEREQQSALLGCLRYELQRARDALLGFAPTRADALIIAELRHATGDTIRMRSRARPFAA